MPRPYLYQVQSTPTKVSAETWTRFYLEQHLQEMVHFKITKTSTLYRSSSETLTYLNPPNTSSTNYPFLALYQMDSTEQPREMQAFHDNVRVTSPLWPKESTAYDVADIVSTGWELVEVLGSYEYNESVAPFVIQVQIFGEEVEGKLQFEHVNAASKLDGYRRSLLYRPTRPEDGVEWVVLIHEFEAEPGDLSLVKEEMQAIEPSKDCSFLLRSFELLGSKGYT